MVGTMKLPFPQTSQWYDPKSFPGSKPWDWSIFDPLGGEHPGWEQMWSFFILSVVRDWSVPETSAFQSFQRSDISWSSSPPWCSKKTGAFPRVKNAGLRIAAGPHSWSRGLWKTVSCQPGSQVPGIYFFPYQIEGGKIWHVTNASIQEIIFLLGYQRGKFIGCWTLGTRKLAKKIQKTGWKWDFGFRG